MWNVSGSPGSGVVLDPGSPHLAVAQLPDLITRLLDSIDSAGIPCGRSWDSSLWVRGRCLFRVDSSLDFLFHVVPYDRSLSLPPPSHTHTCIAPIPNTPPSGGCQLLCDVLVFASVVSYWIWCKQCSGSVWHADVCKWKWNSSGFDFVFQLFQVDDCIRLLVTVFTRFLFVFFFF